MVNETPSRDDESKAGQTASGASEDYQTPIDETQRRTGMADATEAKPTAIPEAGTSEQPVEGAPNQGTEKR